MAAIFCQALCKPCEWLADGCASCCQGMTRACASIGGCCDKLCLSLGKCCASCCLSVSHCLSACCTKLGEIFNKPFSGVVFLTVLLSFVPFVSLIYFMVSDWNPVGCDKPLDKWLLVCLILFVVNFIFAIYLWKRLSGTDFENPALNPKYDPNKHQEINIYNHACHFFLYDPFVCLWILVGIFQVVWGIIGIVWAGGESQYCTDHSNGLVKSTIAGGILLLCFIGIFTIGVLCSLYSGFITVCMNDWNCLKCLCCMFYYPFFYNHERVRERYYGHHNQLVPRSPPAQSAAQAPSGNNGIVVAHAYHPPQPHAPAYGNVVPQPMAAPAQQNMGGHVYHHPARPQPVQQVPQPVYSPPVNYEQHQYPPPPQAQPYHQPPPVYQSYQQSPPPATSPYQTNIAPVGGAYDQQQALMNQYQSQPHPPPAQPSYQPPAQSFAPSYAVSSPPPVVHHGDSLPSAPGGVHPPSGAHEGSPLPVAQPVAHPIAQPIAQAQPVRGGGGEKSAIAKASEGARAALSSMKDFLKKE